jgi:hypothetical protein
MDFQYNSNMIIKQTIRIHERIPYFFGEMLLFKLHDSERS